MRNSTTIFLVFIFMTTFIVSQVNSTEFEITIQQLSISALSKDRAHFVLKVKQSTVMKNFSLYFMFKWNATTGPAVQWFEVPMVRDFETNLTVFIVDLTLPIMWNSREFPDDNYTLTAYLGSNYNFSSTTSLFAWPSLSFPNFENSFWKMNYLGNYTDMVEELEMPLVGSSPSDVGNSWCRLTVALRHTQDFSHYANLMVNYIPTILYVLVIFVFSFPIMLVGHCLIRKRRDNKKSNLIEKIVVPIYVGVMLFIPIFQLSIQPIKGPFCSISQDFGLFSLFTLSVIFLLISTSIRFFIKPEEPYDTKTGEDSSSTENKLANTQKEARNISDESKWVFDTQRESIITWFIVSVTFFIGMIELLPEIWMHPSVPLTVLLSAIFIVLLTAGVFSAYRVIYLVEKRMEMESVYLPENLRMTIWGQHQRPLKWVFKISDDGTFKGVNWPLVAVLLGFWVVVWTLTLFFKLF